MKLSPPIRRKFDRALDRTWQLYRENGGRMEAIRRLFLLGRAIMERKQ